MDGLRVDGKRRWVLLEKIGFGRLGDVIRGFEEVAAAAAAAAAAAGAMAVALSLCSLQIGLGLSGV